MPHDDNRFRPAVHFHDAGDKVDPGHRPRRLRHDDNHPARHHDDCLSHDDDKLDYLNHRPDNDHFVEHHFVQHDYDVVHDHDHDDRKWASVIAGACQDRSSQP
jgi:hypothetical protein